MAKQTFTTGQVLTAAQMTSLQQTAMLGGAASAKTASYTLVAADAGTAITMSNASATTITVNTALFAAGDTVQITNIGAGVCTITAGTATVNTSASLALAQYESGTLNFTSTSAAIFIKGAGAAAGGANYTLLNSGGTTLSGDTTVSGISGKSDLLIYVDAATNLTQTIASLRLNADTTAKYIYAGSQINGLASYSANYFENENSTISGATSIPLGRYNDVTTNALSAAIKIDGCSTSGFKTFNLNGSGSGTPNQRNYNLTGIYLGTAAITSITIRAAAGAFTGGKVYVYGA